MAESNLDLLDNAGMVLSRENLSDADKDFIETLDRDDLMALIRIWNSIPEGFRERNIFDKNALIF